MKGRTVRLGAWLGWMSLTAAFAAKKTWAPTNRGKREVFFAVVSTMAIIFLIILESLQYFGGQRPSGGGKSTEVGAP